MTMVRASPPAGAGPLVLGPSPDITMVKIVPQEKPPVCIAGPRSFAADASCLASSSTNALSIDAGSTDPNLVDGDSITLQQVGGRLVDSPTNEQTGRQRGGWWFRVQNLG
jgi:hypothetical protein